MSDAANTVRIEAANFTPKDLLLGMRGSTEGLPPTAAVQLVATSDRPAHERLEVLRGLLDEESVDEATRAAAAWELRRFKDDEAVSVLLSLVGSESARLSSQAANALGQIGDEHALEVVGRLADGGNEPANWTRILISHRLGTQVAGRDLPRPDDSTEHTLNADGVEVETEHVLAFAYDMFGYTSSWGAVLSPVSCDGSTNVLVPAQQLSEDPAVLTEAPAVAGVLLRRDPAYDSWVDGRYVLTEPDGDGFRFKVTDLGGTVTVVGQGVSIETGFRIAFDEASDAGKDGVVFSDGRLSGSGVFRRYRSRPATPEKLIAIQP